MGAVRSHVAVQLGALINRMHVTRMRKEASDIVKVGRNAILSAAVDEELILLPSLTS